MAKYQVKRVKDFKADKECADDEPKAARSNSVNQTSVINKTIRALREKAKSADIEEEFDDDLTEEELDAFAAKLNLGQAAGNLARGILNRLRGRKPPYTFAWLTNEGDKVEWVEIGKFPREIPDDVLFEWAKTYSSMTKPGNLVLVSLSDSEQEYFWGGRPIQDSDAWKIIRNGGKIEGINLRG